ncbi:siderophore synthetase component [Streptomyces sp. 846.5]|nr:IucA/IucC family siderophore biosynthesis protein [Streptomyces sp. 846.5]TDU03804.1 siderophore synthetase component [Streptomyces sp. 846.5]
MHSEPRPLETSFAAELRQVRPGLVAPYREALPGARAAVLARLLRSMCFEELPGLDRRRLRGPAVRPYDVGAPKDELTVWADGTEYRHPAALFEALGVPGSAGLIAELDHSTASLALSRAGAAIFDPPASAPSEPSTQAAPGGLVAAEQSLVDGHPYHPCCRSRPGLTVADQLAYAPEHHPVVGLRLLALPAASCTVVGDWPEALRDGGGQLLLPVHPWQAREVLPGLGLRVEPGTGLPAHPLLSVRTLAPSDGGAHIKTALSLRMTSSVRDISGGSVVDSARLSALLEEVTGRLDGRLTISRNLAAAGVLVDGALSPALAVMLRESPELQAGPGERVVPVAALTVPAHRPVAWLRSLARLLWPPLLRLLSWGVALEAHGQNLLVVLDPEGRPLRLVYRDLADIRLSPQRLAGIGVSIAGLGSRILDDDPVTLRRKLYGSVVGGSLSTLVAAFGGGDRRVEAALWSAVAEEAERAADVLSPEDRRALLEQPLQVKALCRMRLAGGPAGDQWTSLPNPLL